MHRLGWHPIRTHLPSSNKPFVFCPTPDCPRPKLSLSPLSPPIIICRKIKSRVLNEIYFSEYLINPQNPARDRSHNWMSDEAKYESRNAQRPPVYHINNTRKSQNVMISEQDADAKKGDNGCWCLEFVGDEWVVERWQTLWLLLSFVLMLDPPNMVLAAIFWCSLWCGTAMWPNSVWCCRTCVVWTSSSIIWYAHCSV